MLLEFVGHFGRGVVGGATTVVSTYVLAFTLDTYSNSGCIVRAGSKHAVISSNGPRASGSANVVSCGSTGNGGRRVGHASIGRVIRLSRWFTVTEWGGTPRLNNTALVAVSERNGYAKDRGE